MSGIAVRKHYTRLDPVMAVSRELLPTAGGVAVGAECKQGFML